MQVRVLVLVLGVCFGWSSFAGVIGHMEEWRDVIEEAYNVTEANYYVLQKAFHGGCGGVSISRGGFSYIKNKDISEGLKDGAMSGGFMSALKMVAPTIEGLMSRINDWRIKYLNQSMNKPDLAEVLGLSELCDDDFDCASKEIRKNEL